MMTDSKIILLLLFGQAIAQDTIPAFNATTEATVEAQQNSDTTSYNYPGYNHIIVAVTIFAIVGVIMIVQLISWTIYYVKTKKRDHQLQQLLTEDFDAVV